MITEWLSWSWDRLVSIVKHLSRGELGMADFNFINDQLAVGAAVRSHVDVEDLIAAGVTAVIDCREDFDDSRVFTPSNHSPYFAVNILWNGTKDDGEHKPTSWFKRGIDFALEVFKHSNAKVYCHCDMGVNRGPSMAYAILRAQGYGRAVAETKIRMARPIVQLRYMADADAAIKEICRDKGEL